MEAPDAGVVRADGGTVGRLDSGSGRADAGVAPGRDAGSLVTVGTPTTPAARAVGYWATSGTSCPSEWSGYVYTLCPGGRVRGAGRIGATTELCCGSYTGALHTLPDCDDRYGCFDRANLSYRSTIVLAGQTDVQPSATRTLYLIDDDRMVQPISCNDGSSGLLYLDRIPGDLDDNDCVSDACPATGSTGSGAYGSCGTDCDCGQCWYCERSGGSGTCRYGGEGPYGCYRGCSG